MNTEVSGFFQEEIKPCPYETEIIRDEVKTSFRDGVLYRYSGFVPLLEISGTHFEMGLQYGVLLRPEILSTIAAYKRMITGMAQKMKAPLEFLVQQWHEFSMEKSRNIPQRFFEEVQGISQGSGVPVDDILSITFAYDFAMAGGCTSVLLRGEDGRIIHARNNDTSGFGGVEFGRLTAVVRRRAAGFHTTTQIDYPLWLGIETGYNDQGLAYSAETLRLRNPDPTCFSSNLLVRLILEECSALDELPSYFDRFPVISGYGEIWSSRREGRGWLVEKTPYGWTKREMQEDILWDFNTIYSSELKQYESIEKTLRNDDDREAVAKAFPRKKTYTIQDAVDFLRSSFDGTGDYILFGTRRAICNAGTQQAVVFDPQMRGFYLSWGEQYCSRADFYYVHEDFSMTPELFSPEIPLTEKMIRMCEVDFLLVEPDQKLPGYLNLAQEYPQDADFQFQVAHLAFTTGNRELFIPYAEKASQLRPDVAEYRLYAGIAACWRGDKKAACTYLETLPAGELFLQENLYRLTILELVSSEPLQYSRELDILLQDETLKLYYQEKILHLVKVSETDLDV